MLFTYFTSARTWQPLGKRKANSRRGWQFGVRASVINWQIVFNFYFNKTWKSPTASRRPKNQLHISSLLTHLHLIHLAKNNSKRASHYAIIPIKLLLSWGRLSTASEASFCQTRHVEIIFRNAFLRGRRQPPRRNPVPISPSQIVRGLPWARTPVTNHLSYGTTKQATYGQSPTENEVVSQW